MKKTIVVPTKKTVVKKVVATKEIPVHPVKKWLNELRNRLKTEYGEFKSPSHVRDIIERDTQLTLSVSGDQQRDFRKEVITWLTGLQKNAAQSGLHNLLEELVKFYIKFIPKPIVPQTVPLQKVIGKKEIKKFVEQVVSHVKSATKPTPVDTLPLRPNVDEKGKPLFVKPTKKVVGKVKTTIIKKVASAAVVVVKKSKKVEGSGHGNKGLKYEKTGASYETWDDPKLKSGQNIAFEIKGQEVKGVLSHIHDCKHGTYVVIKFDGKSYERRFSTIKVIK